MFAICSRQGITVCLWLVSSTRGTACCWTVSSFGSAYWLRGILTTPHFAHSIGVIEDNQAPRYLQSTMRPHVCSPAGALFKRSLVLRPWAFGILFVVAGCLPALYAALRYVWYCHRPGCPTRRNPVATDVCEPLLGYRSSARSDVEAIRLSPNGIASTLPRCSDPRPGQVACPSASNIPHGCGDAWCMLVLDLPDGICKVRTHGPLSALLMSQPTTGSHTNLESGVCIVSTRISQGYRSQLRGVRSRSRQRVSSSWCWADPRGVGHCVCSTMVSASESRFGFKG